MSVTRCLRCGNKISLKYRFCPECAFPIWEVDQVSDNLTNHPVPFSLSEEHRRFYAASEVSDTAGDSAERTPDSTTGMKFLVTVENGTGGDYYRPGEKVMITAVAPEGSELGFTGWEITEGDVLLSNRMSETAYFIMPKENVFVSARLSDIKYTVTVTNGEGGGKYSAGDKVTLTANKSEGDHVFKGWKIKSGDMVLSDPGTEIVFFFMPRGDVEIAAIYTDTNCTLTVENGTAGAIELHAGESTILTANEADNGYIFTGWEIEGEASAEDPQKEQTTLFIGNGNVTAKAKYDAVPVLKPGDELHDIFLELATPVKKGIKQNYGQKIKRFKRSDTAPSEGTKTIIISKTGLNVQAWYDESDGTIYWYSNGKLARLNECSGKMFAGFAALREIDFTGIDTGNVTSMNEMFSNCSSLTSLDLSSFDTSNVANMSLMFDGCSSLKSLDLSGFDTRNVRYMSRMFAYCSNLKSLDLSNFATGKTLFLNAMFYGCSSLNTLKVNDTKIIDQYSIR